MAEITFPYAPGFADVPDSVLMAEKYAMGVHLGRMVENAAMGMVRPEVFVGVYINGQTVSLPISPVDGYQYSRDELTYMWATHGLHNLDTGWLSYVDKWWFSQWFVNQTSGLVTVEKWYSNDSGSKNQKTNDGILIVYTFATRRKNSMFMSAIPYYSQHADSDVAIDKALHETPLRDTSRNAKFSIVNSEAIYCGTFKSLDKVAPPVSPVDGYQYDTSEITWLWSWVWTTAGDSYVPPVASLLGGNLLTQLHQLRARVDADGTVHTNVVYYFDQPIDMGDNFGRIAVTAICNRSASSVNGYLGDAAGRINIPHAYMNEPFMYANRWSNWKVPDLPADAEIIALVGVMGIEFTQRAGTYKSYPSTYFNPDNLQLSGIGLTSGGYICGPIHDYTTHSGLYATHTSGGADNYRDGGMGKTLATLNTTVAIAQNKGTLQSADGCELKTTSVAIAIIYSTASGPKGNLGTSVFPPDFVLDPAHSCVWAYPQMAQASPLVQGDYIAPLGTVCEASAATFSTVKVPVSDLGLPLSNEFAWIDSQDLAAGKPTRTDLLVQLNKNIREAVMRPEFFDCGDFVHGQTVPLPASPVDGYQYTQPEVIWMWEFKDTGMNLAGNIRLLDWAVSVDPTTGLVTIKEAHIRDGGRIVWDNQGTLCVKAIGVRSAAHSVPSVPADSSDSSGGGGSETESVVPNGGMDNFSGNGQIIADGWWAIDFAGDYSYSEQPGIVPVGSSQGISIGTSGAGNRAGVRNARLPIFAGDRHLLCFKAKSSVAITTGFLARVRFWNSDATDSVYADVVSGPLDTNPISTSLGIQVPKQGDTDLWTGMGMVALSVAPAWTPAWVSLEFHVDSPDVACTVSVDEVDWARATSDLRGIAIDTATDPADGQVLKYDAATHQYAPADAGSGTGVTIDTDPTLAANSDDVVPSQKAVKSYVDANAGGGGGGSPISLPFTVRQELARSSAADSLSNVTSWTLNFAEALAANGHTTFLFVSCDGSSVVTPPAGWTVDLNKQQNNYARLLVLHKASAGETSVTFTCGSASSFSVYMLELEGTRTFGAYSAVGEANSSSKQPPSITPDAGAMVLALAAYATSTNGVAIMNYFLIPINGFWLQLYIPGYSGTGGRSLSGYVRMNATAAGETVTPPKIPIGSPYANSGIAFATISIY